MSNLSTRANLGAIENGTLSNDLANNLAETDVGWKTAKSYTDLSRLIGFILLNFNPIGLLLNILCFVIFIKLKMYRTAVGLHLTCLSIADALVMFGGSFVTFWFLGRAVIAGYIYPVDSAGFTCRGMLYIRDTGWYLSSFLTLSATVERYLALAYPLKVGGWQLLKKSKILISCFAIISPVLPVYILLT